MPGLVPGIHVLALALLKDVDGRESPAMTMSKHQQAFQASRPDLRRRRLVEVTLVGDAGEVGCVVGAAAATITSRP
jgi:hypothetical protein